MQLRTKIGQVNQRLKGWEAVRWVDGAARVTDLLRAEVDRWGGIGALYGVLRADPWSAVHWSNGIPPERSAEAYDAVQEHITRYGDGIPVLFVEEAPHGLMALGGTTLPVNLALGAGMDPDLTEELAVLVAAEARARGTHVALVSGLDLLRDPRWGRAEECFGEDPALAAALVAATVRGMQGTRRASSGLVPGPIDATHPELPPASRLPDPIDGRHVAVVAKHLAAQGAGIGGRNGSGAPIGPRELGELHLRPAYAAASAGVAGFMAAYNDIDGVPCSANHALLTGTLRDDWGWHGLVMADGTAIDRLRDAAPDPASAAALALNAGVDLSLWDDAYTHIEEALDRGLVTEATLDRAVERVLGLKRRLGLLPTTVPTADHGGPAPALSTPHAALAARRTASADRQVSPEAHDHGALLTRAARQSVVLVHDRAAVLPLSPAATVAVVGPNADDLAAQLGDYTPPRPPHDPEATTVRSALVARIGAERVLHTRGSRLRGPLDATRSGRAGAPLEAVTRACASADVAVVVLGGSSRRSYDDAFADNGAVEGPAPDTTTGEGVDLASVALPQAQLDVVHAARASGRPVVGVVIDGRPRVLTALADLVDALIVAPFPGPRGGCAIVDTLVTGTAAGRLPASFPVADGVFPVAHDERLETARGYLDHRHPRGPAFGTAAAPGLSATIATTRPSPSISTAELDAGGSLTVIVDVRNDGDRPLDLPIPLWGRRHERGLRPRRRTLLAVRRVALDPGGSTVLTFELGPDALGSWSTGRPLAVPVRVDAWCTDDVDQPADATPLLVTAPDSPTARNG
jgi:beta-glucosidase